MGRVIVGEGVEFGMCALSAGIEYYVHAVLIFEKGAVE